MRRSISIRPKSSGKQLALFKELEEIREYRFSLFITNDKLLLPEDVWREYRPRANDENVLKELKEGYGIAVFNMNDFWATESVMIMNALVFHNLFHYLNRNILNPNKSKQQLKTLRYKYFIIPAFLGGGSRRKVLRIGIRDKKLRGKLCYFLEKINLISFKLDCIAVET